MQFYSVNSLERNVGRRRTHFDKINQINLWSKSMKRNPNLSKFGFLINLDLPIQKTNRGEVLNLRLFRNLLYFPLVKYKKYTFFLRKCTQKLENFQNSSTSRTRILIG